MNLPFISRSAHEEVRTGLETQILRLSRLLEKEQQRSEHLMDTVLSLKVSGATSIIRAAAVAGVPAKVDRPISAIDQAIDEHPKASNNLALRAHLSRWAAKKLKQRPEDVDEEEWLAQVCDELRNWSAVSNGDDEDEE